MIPSENPSKDCNFRRGTAPRTVYVTSPIDRIAHCVCDDGGTWWRRARVKVAGSQRAGSLVRFYVYIVFFDDAQMQCMYEYIGSTQLPASHNVLPLLGGDLPREMRRAMRRRGCCESSVGISSTPPTYIGPSRTTYTPLLFYALIKMFFFIFIIYIMLRILKPVLFEIPSAFFV